VKRSIFHLLFVFLVLYLLLACGLQRDSGRLPTTSATPLPAASATPLPTISATPLPAASATPPPTTSATPLPTPLPAQIGAAGIGDPYFPGAGNGGYDVLHYDIDLTVDMAQRRIMGHTTIQARATQALRSFNLDFAPFDIVEVLVNGQPTQYHYEQDEFVVTVAQALAQDADFTVAVAYEGSPGPANNYDLGSGWFWQGGFAYVAAEPFGAHAWYPANDHPLDKATYTFRVTAPAGFVVAANGLLTSTTEEGSQVTYVWQPQAPMASYLATVSIGPYEVLNDETTSGLPIVNFFPTDEAAALSRTFAATPDMIDYLAGLLGPYPFDSYGAIVPGGSTGSFVALETQTRSLFLDEYPLNDDVIVHELAHQWFGDSVSLERWQDIWLKEGFATYTELLWLEHRSGRTAVEQRVAAMYQQLAQQARVGTYRPPGDPAADDLYTDAVYDGGALVLYALRHQIGDDAFFETLRTYLQRYRYGNAGSDDFIAVAEEVSGQDLGPFFDDWLYSQPMPPLPGGSN
jgi:aminopeptidase N